MLFLIVGIQHSSLQISAGIAMNTVDADAFIIRYHNTEKVLHKAKAAGKKERLYF